MISCLYRARKFTIYIKKNDHGGVLLHNYHSGYRVQRVREGGEGRGY